MGLPTKEDNLVNYEKGDVSQDINNFRSHKFLLIHGSGDDNVHIQHSLLLAKKLQYADIDFDEMVNIFSRFLDSNLICIFIPDIH